MNSDMWQYDHRYWEDNNIVRARRDNSPFGPTLDALRLRSCQGRCAPLRRCPPLVGILDSSFAARWIAYRSEGPQPCNGGLLFHTLRHIRMSSSDRWRVLPDGANPSGSRWPLCWPLRARRAAPKSAAFCAALDDPGVTGVGGATPLFGAVLDPALRAASVLRVAPPTLVTTS